VEEILQDADAIRKSTAPNDGPSAHERPQLADPEMVAREVQILLNKQIDLSVHVAVSPRTAKTERLCHKTASKHADGRFR